MYRLSRRAVSPDLSDPDTQQLILTPFDDRQSKTDSHASVIDEIIAMAPRRKDSI